MKKIIVYLAVLVVFCAGTLRAQDLTGEWQGVLEGPKLRTALRIAKGEQTAWTVTFYSVDQAGMDGLPATDFTLRNSSVKFTLPQVGGSYSGTLSADGAAITGTFTQGAALSLNFKRVSPENSWLKDASPHTVSFIPVQENIKLEVLNWGGTGRPVVLLSGLGNSAHVFDTFATKLTPKYHVYGITRRGYGASSVPLPTPANYAADRLGDDVLAVIAALKIVKPVIVGHSIAGEELSSIGSRHPELIAGLVYLDATFSYAFYDSAHGDLTIDLLDMQKKLDQLLPGKGPMDSRPLLQELLHTSLPQLEKDLQHQQERMDALPPPPVQANRPLPPPSPSSAILAGQQKYTSIQVPILAICAVPHDLTGAFKNDPAAQAKAEANDLTLTSTQASAFDKGVPSAKVVRLAKANHYVFKSNEADVLREMNLFIDGLPPAS